MASGGFAAISVIFTMIHIKFVAAKSNAERPEVIHDAQHGVRPNANRYNASIYKNGILGSFLVLLLCELAGLHDISKPMGSAIMEFIGNPAGVALIVHSLEQFATSIIAPGLVLTFHAKARAHLRELLKIQK